MKTKELIKKISLSSGTTVKNSSIILKSFFEIITKSIKKGENVSLRNFGAFKLYIRKERKFYNISKYKVEVLPERKTVRFIPFKQFKVGINKKKEHLSYINQQESFNTPYVLNYRTSYSVLPENHNESKGKNRNTSIVTKNIGTRRTNDVSEFHDSNFEYIGTVNYDHYFGENDHTIFPIIKTPYKGTKILKWYKSHSEAIVGVSEPLMLAEVKQICKKYKGLTVLGNVAIPIQNRIYSYRPDIALFWEEHNICIDIEIDEPYDICSRKPLHYIGCSDNLRDTYFTRNGWCVIRYSENQVINHLTKVIEHLDFVLNWLSGGLEKKYNLFEENRWTYDEAIQMSKSSKREDNLGLDKKVTESFEEDWDVDYKYNFLIKPDRDILPEKEKHSHILVIETQLDYAMASKAKYIKITDTSGRQWILEKETIDKRYEGDDIYITANNVIIPLMSSLKFWFSNTIQIESIFSLFTEHHWKSGDSDTKKQILITAATNGSPIWIKYKNSQGEESERYLCNLCLFLNNIDAQTPFTDLGTIANPKINWRTYIFGYCSIRDEFRQFACDHRLLEIRILNCKGTYIFDKVYQASLAELIMNPYNYRNDFFNRVDYLLSIMPIKEKESYLSIGNRANYETIKGHFEEAIKLYQSIPFEKEIVFSKEEIFLWGELCKKDIDSFINEGEKLKDGEYDYDISPSKIVEYFSQIKILLKNAGWNWEETNQK